MADKADEFVLADDSQYVLLTGPIVGAIHLTARRILSTIPYWEHGSVIGRTSKEVGMRRIRIWARHLSGLEASNLRQLLEAAGCSPDEIEVVDQIGPPDSSCLDEIVAILLTERVCQYPNFEQELAKVPEGGRRAICVWPADVPAGVAPVAVYKFSYSVVSWNSDRLATALADDDVTCFETSSGSARTMEEMERNQCVSTPT